LGIRLLTLANDKISLRIYDILGRCVKIFFTGQSLEAKDQSLIWNGTDNRGHRLPTGIYFVHFEVGNHRDRVKIILVD